MSSPGGPVDSTSSKNLDRFGPGKKWELLSITGLPVSRFNRWILRPSPPLITIMISLEAALVGDLFFNKEWKKDLPNDSTGELKNLIAFIEDNIDIFKWAGVSFVVIQALSLMLAVLIRAMIPSRRLDYDSDEDYFVIRRPLINQPGGQTAGSASGFHSDIWSSRMRQKKSHDNIIWRSMG